MKDVERKYVYDKKKYDSVLKAKKESILFLNPAIEAGLSREAIETAVKESKLDYSDYYINKFFNAALVMALENPDQLRRVYLRLFSKKKTMRRR